MLRYRKFFKDPKDNMVLFFHLFTIIFSCAGGVDRARTTANPHQWEESVSGGRLNYFSRLRYRAKITPKFPRVILSCHFPIGPVFFFFVFLLKVVATGSCNNQKSRPVHSVQVFNWPTNFLEMPRNVPLVAES